MKIEYIEMKVKVSWSCLTLRDPMDYMQSMEFSRPEYWSGWPFPFPGDFPNPGIEPRPLHCRRILYQLSHKGSPIFLPIGPIGLSYIEIMYINVACCLLVTA